MRITNLSAEPLGVLHSWLPRGLDAEEVVFLPDACPGKSPLPTGTAVLTRQEDWRRFAVSDCGCGMRLLRSTTADVSQEQWDHIASLLRSNKGGLGDLGGGNHFLDALAPYDDGPLHFLVHTGSRSESGLVDALIGEPSRFDREFARIVGWARENRGAVQAAIEEVVGPLQVILDLPHNDFEVLHDGGVVIRKGAVRLVPGEFTVIPSHMSGDAVLVRGKPEVTGILNAMSHGTGRVRSRGEAKSLAEGFDFDALRRAVLMPSDLSPSSLRTEGPYAYRDLDSCLGLVSEYVEVLSRFAVVAYMGHL